MRRLVFEPVSTVAATCAYATKTMAEIAKVLIRQQLNAVLLRSLFRSEIVIRIFQHLRARDLKGAV